MLRHRTLYANAKDQEIIPRAPAQQQLAQSQLATLSARHNPISQNTSQPPNRASPHCLHRAGVSTAVCFKRCDAPHQRSVVRHQYPDYCSTGGLNLKTFTLASFESCHNIKHLTQHAQIHMPTSLCETPHAQTLVPNTSSPPHLADVWGCRV